MVCVRPQDEAGSTESGDARPGPINARSCGQLKPRNAHTHTTKVRQDDASFIFDRPHTIIVVQILKGM